MLEKQIQDFYRISLFGNEPDPIIASVKRAYRDFCRTIDFPQKGDHSKAVESVISVFRVGLKQINAIQSIDGFDNWHEILSKEIDNAFTDAHLTLGQIQKWVNMTLKYLIILKEESVVRLLPYLHVPIDSIVLSKSGHSDAFSSTPWSKIADREQYMAFQNKLREEYTAPLEWEFGIWNEGSSSPAKSIQYPQYKYFKGESENPFSPESTAGMFWHGEKMYDQLQNKDYFTEEAKRWRDELKEQNPNCRILDYDDVTLGIILYTDCLFGKFCPYGSFNWIYDY